MDLNAGSLGIMHKVIDDALSHGKHYLIKNNRALEICADLLKVIDPKQWENRKIRMMSQMGLLKRRLLTTIQYVNSGNWGVINGDLIMEEFVKIAGYIGDEANKDDYKNEYDGFDYQDTSKRVKFFYKYLDLIVTNNNEDGETDDDVTEEEKAKQESRNDKREIDSDSD